MQLAINMVIFLARHMILAFMFFGALWWLGPARRRSWTLAPLQAGHGSLPIAMMALVFGLFAVVAAWYLTQGGFAGDVEPVVSSLSWQVASGQTLYTSFEQAERYSVLYGPSVFLTNGLFLKILGPSLASAKIASALAAIGSLLFLYASLAGRHERTMALWVTVGAALYYWAQGFTVYLVRPDSLLLFAICAGFYAAARVRRWLGIVAVAVLAGFAINLKIHCLVYFLPVMAVLVQRWGIKSAVWALAGAVAVAVAPFALYPQISAINYLRWLANETGHGLQLGLLAQPVQYVLFMALPIAVVAWLRGKKLGSLGSQRGTVLALLPGVACGLVLSAKPGSGIVHLLPLVPAVMYVTARLAAPLAGQEFRLWNRRLVRAAVPALMLTVLLAGSVNEYRAIRLVAWQLNQAPGIASDVEEIISTYKGLPMGMALGGEDRWYRYTWLKPLLTFHDNPVLLDPISVMDTVKSGRPLSPATYDALTNGLVSLWLVPREQAPFQKMSWYDPDVPIFPGDFVQCFHDCYTLRGHSRYFDLWFWNGVKPGSATTLVSHGDQSPENLVR